MYVRTRLGRLFGEERGAARHPDDPAIVLLHGLLFDGGMWRNQLAPLAELGRVVVLDGPGHGKSEPAPRFMLEEHADALFDAFGELGIRQAIVVGLSWGGMVAMRFALQHAERVAALALLDTTAEPEPLANRLKYRALIAMHKRIGFPYRLYQEQIVPLLFSERTRVERPSLVESAYRRTMGFERGGLSRAAIAVMIHRKNVLSLLPKINAPTLVIVGGEGRAAPIARSQAIASAIPGADLHVVERAGHMSPLEEPEAVNAALVPFVRRCLARDA